MNITDEQIDALAKEYAKEKSSSDVFRTAHENDFKAGFSKALSLFAVSKSDSIEREISVCDCKHSHYHIEEMAVVVCTDCGELLGKQTDC